MNDTGRTPDASDDLNPLDGDRGEGFDVVRFGGGYDRAQVDDYLERVNASLDEADQRHADDGERIAALQAELTAVQQRLTEAERRASGRPEPASLITGRMAQMLALAEQEAGELRAGVKAEADTLLSAAKEQAAQESGQRLAELKRREVVLAQAIEAAEVTTVQAQRDADVVRAQAKREAENALAIAKREGDAARAGARRDADKTLEQARQDVKTMHEQTRRDAAASAAEARRELEQLSRQRDGIRAQLQQLNDAVAAAMAPLSAGRAPAQPIAGQPIAGQPIAGQPTDAATRQSQQPGSSRV